jgi:protein involved in polysaccharide export with SLBB domain
VFSSRRFFILIALLLASGPTWADASTPPVDTPNIHVDYTPWTDVDYRYRIGAGDELALRFTVDPDLDSAVVVGPDGRGVFPLIGSVSVAGMTADEADRALTEAYATVLRSPQVQALVTSYGSAQIYVGGEVREPGVKTIKGQISVTQAIMAAGGFAETARTGQVAVLRQRRGDLRPGLRVVNIGKVLRAGSDGGDVLLQPGDVVFVPRSAIGEVDLFVKQYLTNLIPFSLSYGITPNGRY